MFWPATGAKMLLDGLSSVIKLIFYKLAYLKDHLLPHIYLQQAQPLRSKSILLTLSMVHLLRAMKSGEIVARI